MKLIFKPFHFWIFQIQLIFLLLISSSIYILYEAKYIDRHIFIDLNYIISFVFCKFSIYIKQSNIVLANKECLVIHHCQVVEPHLEVRNPPITLDTLKSIRSKYNFLLSIMYRHFPNLSENQRPIMIHLAKEFILSITRKMNHIVRILNSTTIIQKIKK